VSFTQGPLPAIDLRKISEAGTDIVPFADQDFAAGKDIGAAGQRQRPRTIRRQNGLGLWKNRMRTQVNRDAWLKC
jgi:hypothetical protein